MADKKKQKDPNRALKLLLKQIDNASAHVHKGYEAQDAGEWEKSHKHFVEAKRLMPKSFDDKRNQAALDSHLKEIDVQIELAEKNLKK